MNVIEIINFVKNIQKLHYKYRYGNTALVSSALFVFLLHSVVFCQSLVRHYESDEIFVFLVVVVITLF